MTMTRVYLVCIESGHVAFTSEEAAKRAGYTDSTPILLLDGPIQSRRRGKWRHWSSRHYEYQPLAGHGSGGSIAP